MKFSEKETTGKPVAKKEGEIYRQQHGVAELLCFVGLIMNVMLS
ncbi:hypothetical protein [Chryseobacterium taklimakanense]|nr:hypothetical protein [Chryseobacterium taklimakanense]